MRFLVLGACGMVGHLIAIFLREQGHDVTGFARREAAFLDANIVGDAFDDDALRHAIDVTAPDVIVNSIALLNAAADNHPAKAIYLNSYLPHHVSDLCENMPVRIFHISSDGVFAGNSGPYHEGSIPDDPTRYGRTKALGELKDAKNLTFRTSIIGPDINQNGIGLLNWFMARTGQVKGYTQAIWTGLSSLELAKAINCCAREEGTGLVNMVPDSNISKYDLLRLFNEHMRCSALDVIPDGSLCLDRTLVRTNFDSKFMPASYEEQVVELSAWVREHKGLYPHYRHLPDSGL